MSDFYDGMTEETAVRMKKLAPYIELARKQGDALYMDGKPWEIKIIIRVPKKVKEAKEPGF